MVTGPQRIQETLFGRAYCGIDTLVVTPLQPIFDAFAPALETRSRGWWDAGIISSNGKNHVVVKGPVCSHIEDVIHYLPDMQEVLLLGFCGAYSRRYDVGDLVSCAVAELDDRVCDASSLLSANGVRMYQVPNFSVQTEHYVASLVQRGIDCVDMETFTVLHAARRGAKTAGAFHVVSDTVEKPFYSLDADDLNKIRAGIGTMVDITLRYLENRGGPHGYAQ